MKPSYKDRKMVDGLGKQLEGVYSKLGPMKISSGKVLQYLGITIDYKTSGKVRISMNNYVKKIIDEIPAEMIGTKLTAISENLLKNDVDVKLLDEQREQSQLVRPDFQLAVK